MQRGHDSRSNGVRSVASGSNDDRKMSNRRPSSGRPEIVVRVQLNAGDISITQANFMITQLISSTHFNVSATFVLQLPSRI